MDNIKIENTYAKWQFRICIGLVCLICICLFIIYKNCALFCITLGTVGICFSVENYLTKIFSIMLLILMVLFISVGWISFDFIPQAFELLKHNTDLLFWFKQGHIHAIRLAIAYPSYIMHNIFSIELNKAFSYYCSIIFEFIFLHMCSIKDRLIKPESYIYTNFILLFFVLLLSFAMNGRICFAFLGYSILIKQMNILFSEIKLVSWVKRYAEVIIGIILTTVSSGTMIVAILFVISMVCFRIMKFKWIGRGVIRLIVIGAMCSRVILYCISYVMKMIDKNINYFGGGVQGVVNMLQHGVGKVFGRPSDLFFITLVFVGAIVIIFNIMLLKKLFYKFNATQFTLFVAINIAFYGGFVGISTGTLMIIPVAILFINFLDNQLADNRKEILLNWHG